MEDRVLQRLDPVEFYKRFAEQHTRPDGRAPLECRTTSCCLKIGGIVGTAHGSSSVKLGGTTVIATVTCERQTSTEIEEEEAEESKDSSFTPIVVASNDMDIIVVAPSSSSTSSSSSAPFTSSSTSSTSPPLSTTSSTTTPITPLTATSITVSTMLPEFRSGRVQLVSNSTRALDITGFVSGILLSPGILDSSSFHSTVSSSSSTSHSSTPGTSTQSTRKFNVTWRLLIDILCTTYDGNVIDAALLATVGAIQSTRYPTTTTTRSSSSNGTTTTSVITSLMEGPKFHHIPVPLTFVRVVRVDVNATDKSKLKNDEEETDDIEEEQEEEEEEEEEEETQQSFINDRNGILVVDPCAGNGEDLPAPGYKAGNSSAMNSSTAASKSIVTGNITIVMAAAPASSSATSPSSSSTVAKDTVLVVSIRANAGNPPFSYKQVQQAMDATELRLQHVLPVLMNTSDGGGGKVRE